MKKLFNILILLTLAVSLQAQIYDGRKYLGQNSDTVIKDGVITKIWELMGDKPYNFSVSVKLDSISGYPKATSILEYSIGGVDYFPLAINDTSSSNYSVTNLTGIDTAFTFKHSNQFMGNYLRLKVTAIDSTQTTKVTAYFKNWYKNKF